MSHFDVFNGDADGICALQQLRLATPLESTLITGVKRDIRLLERVAAHAGDTVTVLDVSMDRNREALLGLLAMDVQIEYFDHHFAGPIPGHRGLQAHIDPAPGVCTSVLVDRHLQGRHRLWAVVAAFGDNMARTAREIAQACGLAAPQAARLCELGEAMNYNAYGASEADLLMPPAELYRAVHPYASPFDFIDGEPTAGMLNDGRRQDMALARRVKAAFRLPAGDIYVLPEAAWARRVHGALANELAASSPELAHAVLCERASNGYIASVRAPLARPVGADRLCRRFPGGGGRAGAGGIDELAPDCLQHFVDAFSQAFGAQVGQVVRHGDSG